MVIHGPVRRWASMGLKLGGAVIFASVLLTSLAGAQTVGAGTIQGKVADDTGATLPGVTVTVASPALQLREVAGATDAQGAYRFVDLPPAVYRIKYELAGFQMLVQDGLRLNAGFTARVDVVMKIGAVAESVTVTGQGPVVDVASTVGSTNFTKEMLEKVPTSRSMWQVLAMTPHDPPAPMASSARRTMEPAKTRTC